MGVINAAALAALGFLLLRKLVLMDRFFAARVVVITTILCGLLLFFALKYLSEPPPCLISPDEGFSVYACTEV